MNGTDPPLAFVAALELEWNTSQRGIHSSHTSRLFYSRLVSHCLPGPSGAALAGPRRAGRGGGGAHRVWLPEIEQDVGQRAVQRVEIGARGFLEVVAHILECRLHGEHRHAESDGEREHHSCVPHLRPLVLADRTPNAHRHREPASSGPGPWAEPE